MFERGLREEKSHICPYMLSAKQESICLVCGNRGSNTRPPAHGANALTLSHRCGRAVGRLQCRRTQER